MTAGSARAWPRARARPFARATLRLTLSCLVLAGLVWRGQAAESGPPAASAPASGAAPESEHKAPGVERAADQDVLWLRNGERLAGVILTERLSLRTAYGLLSLATARIAGIDLGRSPLEQVVVLTDNRNRLSGFLETPQLLLQPKEGAPVTMRCERVLKVVCGAREREREGGPPRPFVVLRSGDCLTGRLPAEWPVATESTNRVFKTEDLRWIKFLEGDRRQAQVALRNGEAVAGTWPTEDLDFELELGPRVRFYHGVIDAIYWQEADLPQALLAGTARAGSGPSDAPAGVVPPEGMVWIPPGQFTMGSPAEEIGRDLDEGPQTEVTLTRGFWMAIHEVTQAQYTALMGSNPSVFVGNPQRPVEKVTWREAMDYCQRLTQRHAEDRTLPAGCAYRLPTEAEWEYACRAGSTTRFSHGEDPDALRLAEYAWYSDNSGSEPHPVGTRKPNAWGLHDLHGNVLEWCLDAATSSLPGGKANDYRAPAGGSLRMARGGSWLYPAKACRCANRDNYSETTRCSDLGFRVVLAPN